jgi:uncharacterized membrane protein
VFFSDAAFAIAITLLATDIHVPNVPRARLAAELRQLLPSIGVYALTFVVIGAYWVAHHRMYRRVVRFDYSLVWLNMLVLLCVAFLPVPNAILARHYDSPAVVLFYAASLIATSLSTMLLWWYASAHRRLIADDVSHKAVREVFWESLAVITLALLATVIAFWSTRAAFTLLVAFAGVGLVTSIVATSRERLESTVC